MTVATLPDNAATLVIANEFFDALPITQYARTPSGWREINVTLENNELAFAHGPEQKNPFSPVQAALLPNTAPEEIIEASPARELVMQNLCTHLKRVRGAALIIDYGYASPAAGDSFQAMKHHEFVDPLACPGEADLTAHVNFAVLSQLAAATGLEAYPIAQQGNSCVAWGSTSAPRNLPGKPRRRRQNMGERDRLAAPDQMGHLFKVLGCAIPTCRLLPDLRLSQVQS